MAAVGKNAEFVAVDYFKNGAECLCVFHIHQQAVKPAQLQFHFRFVMADIFYQYKQIAVRRFHLHQILITNKALVQVTAAVLFTAGFSTAATPSSKATYQYDQNKVNNRLLHILDF